MEKIPLVGTRNLRWQEIALNLGVGALRCAVESMLQHSSCQSFEIDFKDMIAMINEPQAWPSFATKLEAIHILQICFPNFKISHIP